MHSDFIGHPDRRTDQRSVSWVGACGSAIESHLLLSENCPVGLCHLQGIDVPQGLDPLREVAFSLRHKNDPF